MTVKSVCETSMRLIGASLSRLFAFVGSGELKSWFHKIVGWIKPAALWIADALVGLVFAVIRFLNSDGFRDGVKRLRALAILGGQRGLRGIRWVLGWLHGLANTEAVKAVVATTSDLFDLLLPKSTQRISAGVIIFIVSIILVLSWPEAEQTETLTGPEATVSGLKQPSSAISRIVSGMPKFGEIPAGRERKAAFFGYFLPIIEHQNREILATREKLDGWYQNPDKISSRDAAEIDKIAARYRIDDFDIESDKSWNQLFNRVDVVPPSLALAQSANESAWGTSRFAREGQNFFGQWCFRKGCGLVPKKRDANKTHEVAAFDSPQESVKMYIRNLNSNSAYKGLRDIRAELRRANKAVTGHALAAGLKRYSERGMAYVSELRHMIATNKLAIYDTF